MKKIGIITIHYNCNYGAVLQTYALQETLCEYGFEAEIINYINDIDKRRLDLFGEGFIRNMRTLLSLRRKIRRIKGFKNFIFNRYNLSSVTVYNPNQLSEYLFDYDVYITGSDQTFNLLLYDNPEISKPYFLPFVSNAKKISYASSCGEKISVFPPEIKDWMKKALSSYNQIAVRENTTADFIASLGIAHPLTVLDPTLLITKSKWDTLAIPTKYPANSYILFYSVLSDSWVIKEVKKIAKKYNLKVVVPHLMNKFETFSGFTRADDCSPEEFLSLVRNAAFVCTTSFHGTVFSVLYEKNFVSFVLGEGNRIKSLLNSLDLSDRIISNERDKAEEIINKDINYEAVNDKLTKLRETSLQYLKNI